MITYGVLEAVCRRVPPRYQVTVKVGREYIPVGTVREWRERLGCCSELRVQRVARVSLPTGEHRVRSLSLPGMYNRLVLYPAPLPPEDLLEDSPM